MLTEPSQIHYALTGLMRGCCQLNELEWVRQHVCKGSLACVNALSSQFRALSAVDGRAWEVAFRAGIESTPLSEVDAMRPQGVVLEFVLDGQLVPDVEVDAGSLRRWWSSLPVALDADALDADALRSY